MESLLSKSTLERFLLRCCIKKSLQSQIGKKSFSGMLLYVF